MKWNRLGTLQRAINRERSLAWVRAKERSESIKLRRVTERVRHYPQTVLPEVGELFKVPRLCERARISN